MNRTTKETSGNFPLPESILFQREGMVKWLFLGDSITQGALHTFGFRSYPEIFSDRVRYELGRKDDLVLNAAWSGATSMDVLEQAKKVFGIFCPDAVFLMTGVNDASPSRSEHRNSFERTFIELVELARSLNAAVICQTPPPIDFANAPDYRDGYEEILAGTRSLAADHSVTLIDHHAIWTEEIESRSHGRFLWFMSDAVHPNQFGHNFMARTIFERLGILDESRPTCRQFFP